MTLDYPPGNTELGSYQSWLVNNELGWTSKDGKMRLLLDDLLSRSGDRDPRECDLQLPGRPETESRSG